MAAEVFDVVEVPNVLGCSFCKRDRRRFAFAFINEARDTFICRDCVSLLHVKLTQVDNLGTLDAPARTN